MGDTAVENPLPVGPLPGVTYPLQETWPFIQFTLHSEIQTENIILIPTFLCFSLEWINVRNLIMKYREKGEGLRHRNIMGRSLSAC